MLFIMHPGARQEQVANVIAAVERQNLPSHIIDGADGLIIEVHNDPANALSDGRQSLTPEKFTTLVKQVKMDAEAVERRLAPVILNRACHV